MSESLAAPFTAVAAKKKKKRLAFLPVIDLKFTKLLLKMERQTVGKLIATALSKHLVIV